MNKAKELTNINNNMVQVEDRKNTPVISQFHLQLTFHESVNIHKI